MALIRHYTEVAAQSEQALPTTVVRSDTDPRDAIAFCADVNLPDHSPVLPGERFTKTWLVQNVGQRFWRGRDLVCVTDQYVIGRYAPDGRARPLLHSHLRSAQPWVRLTDTPPGGMCEVSMDFVAPQENCSVISLWRIRNAQGAFCYDERFFLQAIVTVLGA